MSRSTATRLAALAGLCLALGAATAGCGDKGGTTNGAGPGPSDASATSSPSSDNPQPTSHHTKKTQPAKPSQAPLAPRTIAPVVRNGVRPHPSISAAPQPFTHVVHYPDGVRLKVTAIHQGRVSGQGPGVVQGPRTTFDLLFSNGSKRAVNLDQVVPTAEFGSPARIASPVYDDQTQDFGTTVRPGHSEKAVYAFSIPVADLNDVTIHLDFDGRHYAATFHGSARG
jgi:hypothetical protein